MAPKRKTAESLPAPDDQAIDAVAMDMREPSDRSERPRVKARFPPRQ